MDERTLLLLGILRVQSQHGYQINEFIERNLARVTDMKKPTAYAILDRLSQSGLIAVHTDQEGNRPPRKVYAITPEGEAVYFELLRRFLAEPERQPAGGNVALMFLDDVPHDEQLRLVEQRLSNLDQLIATYASAPKHEHGMGVDLAIEQQLHLLRAEHEWLSTVLLPRLEGAEPESASVE
jgi:DNA-binding PadR family transcriptional regulator